jgi:hypothetical protein
MVAGSAPQQRLTSSLGDNLILIVLGSVLLVFTLLVLTLFDNAITRQRSPLQPALVSADGKFLPPLTTVPGDALVVQPPAAQAVTIEDSLRAAVERANQAFIQARGQANATPLQSVAVGEWLAQEQSALAGIRAYGQTERWRLVRLEYVQIEPRSATTGFVCTREVWEVTTLGPGSAVGTTRTYTFQEGYDLIKNGANWVVTRIVVGQG